MYRRKDAIAAVFPYLGFNPVVPIPRVDRSPDSPPSEDPLDGNRPAPFGPSLSDVQFSRTVIATRSTYYCIFSTKVYICGRESYRVTHLLP